MMKPIRSSFLNMTILSGHLYSIDYIKKSPQMGAFLVVINEN